MERRGILISAIGFVTGAATLVLSLWCTYIAFVGGTMPLIGIETKGSVGFGLVWLFLIDPLVVTVCYWVSILLASAVLLPLLGIQRLTEGRTTSSPSQSTSVSGSKGPAQSKPTPALLTRWAPDPLSRRHSLRYWDGSKWTDHVSDNGVQSTDPLPRWAPDPLSRHSLRYWDGSKWTDHVSDNGVQSTDPISGA